MPSNHLILCRPLLLPSSIFPSIRVFSNGSVLCVRWPKYWNISFIISPSNEYSGLISFRMNWFDLLAVQGTFKSLLQHTIVQKHQFFSNSAFFLVQLSHLYMTTGKITAPKQYCVFTRMQFDHPCAHKLILKSHFSLVAQSYPTLCDSMDCSTPGLSVHHQLLKFTQTHVH